MDTILLTLSIICGQLLKIPIGTNGGLILLDAAAIFFCIRGLIRTRLHLIKPPLWIGASFVFIIIGTLSLVITPLSLTPIELFTSASYIGRFSIYILLSWLIYSQAFPGLKNNLVRVLFTSGLILAVLGLLQLILLPDMGFLEKYGWDPHYFRTVSTFLDPNFLGAYLVLTILLLHSSTPGGLASRSEWISLTPRVITSFLIVFLALLATFSRSSYLMFLVSGISLSFFRKSRGLFLVVILLFAILMAGFYLYTQVVAKPRNIDREQSASSRVNTWHQGWSLFQKFPVFGVGYNAYRFGLKELNLADDKFLKSHGASSNDSSLLFVAATTGLLGFLSYLFFLYQMFRISYSNNHYNVCVAITGLLVQSFFANSLFYPPLLIWVILMMTYEDSKTS